MIATCHTAGCANADAAIEVERPVDDDGDPVGDEAWSVVCGVCAQEIADLVEDVPTREGRYARR